MEERVTVVAVEACDAIFELAAHGPLVTTKHGNSSAGLGRKPVEAFTFESGSCDLGKCPSVISVGCCAVMGQRSGGRHSRVNAGEAVELFAQIVDLGYRPPAGK